MPQDFWGRADDISTGLSLRELDLVVRGAQARAEREQRLVAWHAANVMNMWAKRGTKITADKLLGKDESNVDPRELTRQLQEESARQKGKTDLVEELTRDEEYDYAAEVEELDRWAVEVQRRLGLDPDLVDEDPGDTLDEAEA